ncbi:MAG: hypothetical protein RID91_09505 [Azospirillaceae bacterium]
MEIERSEEMRAAPEITTSEFSDLSPASIFLYVDNNIIYYFMKIYEENVNGKNFGAINLHSSTGHNQFRILTANNFDRSLLVMKNLKINFDMKENCIGKSNIVPHGAITFIDERMFISVKNGDRDDNKFVSICDGYYHRNNIAPRYTYFLKWNLSYADNYEERILFQNIVDDLR